MTGHVTIDPLCVTSRGARGGLHWRTTGAVFHGENVQRLHLQLKAHTSDSQFSYSCSMLDLPWCTLQYRLAGRSPGTAME